LGISSEAKAAADNLGLVPSEIFAHPEVVAENPNLLKYYRLLACLPAKGLAQIRKKSTKASRVQDICILLNRQSRSTNTARGDKEVFCEGETRKSSLPYNFPTEYHDESGQDPTGN
jgi:hypothetical protein